jgi:hypothetical protein
VSVEATINLTATVVEVLEGNTDSASAANRTITHSLFNVAKSLNASSTPAATKTANFVKSLSAGAGSIDLTALTGANGATVDGTGLKVRAVRVTNLGANALTITDGASNGHPFGWGSYVLPAGATVMIYTPDGTAIAAGDRTWDLSGTTTQQSQWTIVMG